MRQLYCLLGDPVAHSRSPVLMSRAFSLLGIDAVYAPCRVAAPDLPRAVAGLRALGAAGFNVTVPHKPAALPLCDRASEDARRIGAVNCAVREGEAFVGHNTDAPGLRRALEAAGVDPSGRAVIVGAGGSAQAAAAALDGLSRHLAVLNRSLPRAEALARSLSAGAEAAVLGTPRAAGLLAEASIVVHCTAVGMGSDELPLDPARLPAQAAVVDLVYAGPPGSRPGETALVRSARDRGLRVVDGIDVLVRQAIASLALWLREDGLDGLFAPLRAAALEALT